MKTKMPEVIYAYDNKGHDNILYHVELEQTEGFTPYIRSDKHEELKAIAEKMAVALEEICRGSCYDINWQSDGKDYGVASKALTEYNKYKGE